MASSQDHTINILLATFAGLGLPRTLSLPTKSSTTVSDVYTTILSRLPPVQDDLILTTVSNKQLLPHNEDPVSTLLSSSHDTILSLRLSRKLCGGKGGFGSQLRAAGGRMSSRKNRNSNVNPNGSNRNLDGRRLRTVDEAKKLAEYLAIKPDMEKKEKEERKRRWEAVVEAAEKRETEMKDKNGARGRLDAEWVEGKEGAEEKVREAVMRAMREQIEVDGKEERTGSETDEEDVGEESSVSGSGSGENLQVDGAAGRSFFGWDEEEDDSSEDDEEEDAVPEQQEPPKYEGKGKARAS
ncbi:Telomere maintenance protein SDE2 [Fulvia fulva]|uniref:Telomere maintenance protein SDE2 n=1 Tax=Passalora fulva TaxID=5499 RepID=A0A9Q8L655_PASFU|nr:Telomere maintenance protein SDE2 [Fulvia fulva]KAK4635497.1 Telomere maintenance protein SDE2 [Fulvia fulva]KAK4637346.1 Telomere maintenance protein SDE2 [Fulvia fulva]UJO11517.1 Telomere maintenance protein SDE2 [Fulvia fulva]WPV10325.1 Telomere maintenance protein SDE2 [Fulvia fulva]WPV25038.1 Telomere maintenance protein SDE2 [Fulvia fulva]